ncbi:MAG: hypothetical protein HOC21_07685 [Phycisphaerae bacterium]|nr:hypothetical protein [Phycisphaerae bacterium]
MSQPSTNGRNTNGQFTHGNKYGKGNPYARHVARLRTLLIEAVGDDGLADIVQGMVTAAKGGDVAAAKLLLSYLLGKPVESVEPDYVEIHERELHSKDRGLDSDDKIAAMFM